MKLKAKKHAAAFVCAGATLALAGCAQHTDKPAASTGQPSASRAATPVTVGLTYIPNVQFAPMYLAAQRHYLPAGVKLHHHGQNEGLFTGLLSGHEQVVVAGADEAAAAKANNLVVIAPYYETYPVTIIVPEDSAIRSIADLKGKKVGIPGRYGEGWYGLKQALANAHMTIKDINLIEIGYTQKAALKTGKVDAVVGFINNDAVQFALAGMKTRTITPKNTGLLSASLITTKEFAAKHPLELKKLVTGAFRAYADIKANPETGVEASEKFIPQLSEPAQKTAALATMKATAKLLPSSTMLCKSYTPTTGKKLVKTLTDIGVGPIQTDGADLFTPKFC